MPLKGGAFRPGTHSSTCIRLCTIAEPLDDVSKAVNASRSSSAGSTLSPSAGGCSSRARWRGETTISVRSAPRRPGRRLAGRAGAWRGPRDAQPGLRHAPDCMDRSLAQRSRAPSSPGGTKAAAAASVLRPAACLPHAVLFMARLPPACADCILLPAARSCLCTAPCRPPAAGMTAPSPSSPQTATCSRCGRRAAAAGAGRAACWRRAGGAHCGVCRGCRWHPAAWQHPPCGVG